MCEFEGLAIPRYVVNRVVGWRRLGTNVEFYFGLGEGCIPDYSVVVSLADGTALMAQIAAVFGSPMVAPERVHRLAS